MIRLFQVIATLFVLSFGILAHAQPPGTLLEVTPTGRAQPSEIRQLAAPLFELNGVPRLAAAVDTYRVRYLTTDFDGSMTEVVAQLFVPVYTVHAERPIYAFGSGTTGIAEKCAPSREYQLDHPLGHYQAYMLTYASRGFIGIVPDYLGFNDPNRLQAYFNALAEGRVLLDAIRATYAFFEQHETMVRPSDAVFTAGYSQGGHAAFAAADMQPDYAPEVPLTGMIGYGATTNVQRLMREGAYYTPYIVQSYTSTYGTDMFDPEKILAERWLPSLETVASISCVDHVQLYYPYDAGKLYTPEFAAALYGNNLAEKYPKIKYVLEQNQTGLSGHGLPALIVQGEDDIIARTGTQEQFVAELCARGSAVSYLYVENARHRHTREVGFEASIDWMDALARGQEPPSVCDVRFASPE